MGVFTQDLCTLLLWACLSLLPIRRIGAIRQRYLVFGMEWLRLVGSLKLQVSFAEYSLFYRALLQKRPIILRSLLVEANPYIIGSCPHCNTLQHTESLPHHSTQVYLIILGVFTLIAVIGYRCHSSTVFH